MSNLVAFKGGAPKVRPIVNRFGIGASSTMGIANSANELDVLENTFNRMCLSTSRAELTKLRQFDPKAAYENFPVNGDDTRFDKTDVGLEDIPISFLASGALIAKDFYNDKESGDKLMELVNYCYQEGIIRVSVNELPTELVGYVINLYEGSKYQNSYSEVMYQYAGVNKEFPSAWNFEGEPQEYRDQRLAMDPDWT
jgi:hypothetical protein